MRRTLVKNGAPNLLYKLGDDISGSTRFWSFDQQTVNYQVWKLQFLRHTGGSILHVTDKCREVASYTDISGFMLKPAVPGICLLVNTTNIPLTGRKVRQENPRASSPHSPRHCHQGQRWQNHRSIQKKKWKKGCSYGQKENKCLCRVGVGTANKSSCNAHVHLVSGLNASDEHLTPA